MTKLLTYDEALEIWLRWKEVTEADSLIADTSYALMREFLGDKSTYRFSKEGEGYQVSDKEYERAKMILGPHYRTIIKAWLIKREHS